MPIARYWKQGDDGEAEHALGLDSAETRWIVKSCQVTLKVVLKDTSQHGS